ncbi:MAG TPA: sortase, partial [Jatrophihabitantaceae bacterium]|nr:sortase [Jatrophihabitantaceae bacterium]
HAPRPLPPPVPHQFVAPAAPTSFEMKGAGFDIKATACQMDDVLPLDPPGEQEHTVCWVRNTFGVAPGSSSGGTSYILGHSWAENPLEVLNPMSELAMKQVDFQKPHPQSGIPTYPITDLNGYRVILHTSTGVLTYKVADAFAVSKDQAAYVKPLMAATTPNRVVLITCGVLNGVDVDVNIVVDAYLESSTAT